MIRSPGRRRWTCLLLLLVSGSGIAHGCRFPAAVHAESSPEALTREVLRAMARQDVERLQQLTVTRQEFRDLIWPELPAARPDRNLTVDYVWNDLEARSLAARQRTLRAHKGERPALVKVSFTGGTSRGRRSLIHRESVVTLQRPDGAVDTVRLFGSVWQYRGGFKVFSWVTD